MTPDSGWRPFCQCEMNAKQALEVVNGMQPAEQVGSLAILAREFGLLASVGSDFHAPAPWAELGLYRPLPEDLSPLWLRFGDALSGQRIRERS